MKKILIFVFLLIVLTVVFEVGGMMWRVRLGKALAEQARAFSLENSNATFRILVVGDSTAVGTGASSPEDSLAGRIAKDYPNVSITNIARNSLRADDIAQRISGQPEKNFDLVIVHAGANDILHFTKLSKLEIDITQTLRAAKEHGQYVVLLTSGNVGLAPFFPRPIGWIFTYRTKQVRELFSRIARTQDVIYVDLFTERNDDPFLKDPQRFYAKDYLHPSSAGYRIWYEQFLATLQQNNVSLQ